MNEKQTKEECFECRKLPEGVVIKGHNHRQTNEGWKEELRNFYYDQNMHKDFVSWRITVAKIVQEAEQRGNDDAWAATRLLWDRMNEWNKEWQEENPKERALTYEDALRLIEWKISQAEQRVARGKEFFNAFLDSLGMDELTGNENERNEAIGFNKAVEIIENYYNLNETNL